MIFASQSGVINRLEILFIGGFQVVCNLNTLVIDRVYIFIENPIYLLRFSVWSCCKPLSYYWLLIGMNE